MEVRQNSRKRIAEIKYKSVNGIKKETRKHIWSGKDKYVPELANAIEKNIREEFER